MCISVLPRSLVCDIVSETLSSCCVFHSCGTFLHSLVSNIYHACTLLARIFHVDWTSSFRRPAFSHVPCKPPLSVSLFHHDWTSSLLQTLPSLVSYLWHSCTVFAHMLTDPCFHRRSTRICALPAHSCSCGLESEIASEALSSCGTMPCMYLLWSIWCPCTCFGCMLTDPCFHGSTLLFTEKHVFCNSCYPSFHLASLTVAVPHVVSTCIMSTCTVGR